MPQAPEFWAKPGLLSDLLLPLAWGHAGLSAARRALAHPKQASVPVLCVGNLVAGGAGKTPVVLSLAAMLLAAGHRPQILSRGYGGTLAGPVRVDTTRHSAAEVGDEPLLLARAAPVWIGRDRAASADAAIAAGADVLLLDDGFQNPTLHQDLALVVVDGAYGLGNGRVIPAGPLREPARTGLARAQAVVLMGAAETRFDFGDALVLRAKLVPQAADHLRGQKLVAFAGIGRPQKFFATLAELGAVVIAQHAFPDHHRYQDAELDRLQREATATGATLITTEKDLVRLEPRQRAAIAALKVEIAWADRAAIEALLVRLLGDKPLGA
jgi:tetraacyldisaccharide 4'-kinase